MKRYWSLISQLLLIVFAISCFFRVVNYSPLKLHYEKPSDDIGHHQNRKHPMKGVIIFTNFRSGSTFVGELFNQHPDVFYNFEPLASINSNNQSRVVETLRSILGCRFQNMSTMMDKDVKASLTIKKCMKDNICFRAKVSELCGRQFCANPYLCGNCKLLKPSMLNGLCTSRKLMAVKIIRQHKLSDLKPLFEDDNLDLKILHLIRDPRGISSSRLKIGHSGDMSKTCTKIYQNTKFGLMENPDWLDGRYKLIRYEDVAINPVRMTEEIYRFVGIEMVDSIKKWIQINTQGKVEQSTDTRTIAMRFKNLKRTYGKLSGNKFNQLVLSSAYTTVRHSNATWQAWRSRLNTSTIEKIQQDCETTMKLLGYNPLCFDVSDKQYINAQPLLSPLESFNDKTFSVSNLS